MEEKGWQFVPLPSRKDAQGMVARRVMPINGRPQLAPAPQTSNCYLVVAS